jgi:hypothetical protein
MRGYPYWNATFVPDVVHWFDKEVKERFSGNSVDDHEFRLHGLQQESRAHGIPRPNLLVFSDQELRERVFDEVIDKILGLVERQIAQTTGRVKAIMLAGGFGKNPYLIKRLGQVFAGPERAIKVCPLKDRQVARKLCSGSHDAAHLRLRSFCHA